MLIPEFCKTTSEHQGVKKIALFGSTGSIGESTLEVIRSFPDRFAVSVLVGGSNYKVLLNQIGEFKPAIAVLGNSESLDSKLLKQCADEVKKISPGTELQLGSKSVTHAARSNEYDLMVAAIVGIEGLTSVHEAVLLGKNVALANKESLICAGRLLTDLCKKTGAKFLPVDSEHSALWQALGGNRPEDIHKLIITASGGPFFNQSRAELQNISVADALNHPRWAMGKKISIDSSTLFNKGLELIEARWLFDFDPDKIEAVIHPQSIVHSSVAFCDGTQIFQCSLPDMKGAIGYALSYPYGRLPQIINQLDLEAIGSLEFFPVDEVKFPAYRLAKQVASSVHTGDAVVMNAADEFAVEAFLSGRIQWNQIIPSVQGALDDFGGRSVSSIEDIANLDSEVRASLMV